jgi:hypothetical protein
MTNETTARDRLILAVIAFVASILLMTWVPATVISAMDVVMKGAVAKIAATQNALLAPATTLVTFFFPFWGALCTVAGAALLVLVYPIYRGERWARPAAVGLLAIPSITGAYMTGPIMSFAPGAQMLFVIVMMAGLIPYFGILLWERSSWKHKAANFVLFLLLGVTAAWTFANGHSSLRMILARPQLNVFNESLYGYLFNLPVVWAGVLATVIAIPLLAARTRAGWWLALSAVVVMLVGTIGLYITHPNVAEFVQGIAMAVGSLVLLLIPGMGGLAKQTEKSKGGAAQNS